MINRCSECGGETVSHSEPAPFCWSCVRPCAWTRVDPAEAGSIAQSWEGLLGQSDEQLMSFCRQLAEEAFGEGEGGDG